MKSSIFPKGIPNFGPKGLPNEICDFQVEWILKMAGTSLEEYKNSMKERGFNPSDRAKILACLEDDLGCPGGSWKRKAKANGTYRPIYKD